MAVSEDHTSCWVYKDLTVTTKRIRALLTTARAPRRKDECHGQVRLTSIEREYWMGTEIGRLVGYSFRGTFTAGDESNQKGGGVAAGFLNLRLTRKRQQRKVECNLAESSSMKKTTSHDVWPRIDSNE